MSTASIQLSAASSTVPGARSRMSTTQDGEIAHLRPAVVRRATNQILSYYQSAEAGRAYIPPSRVGPAQEEGSYDSPPSSPSSSYSDFEGLELGSEAPDKVVYGRRTRRDGRRGTFDIGAGASLSATVAQHPESALDDTATHPGIANAQASPPPLTFASSTSTSTSAASPRLRTPASREFAPSSFDAQFERTVANPGQHRRRTSERSLGAADKRRIAIVELDGEDFMAGGRGMDSADECAVLSDGVDRDAVQKVSRSLSNNTTASSSSSSSNYSYSYFDPQSANGAERSADGHSGSLRARRGFAGTFALVAPPDASPSAYTDFTPPLTAPPGVHLAQYQIQPLVRNASSGSAAPGTHLRSKSEASGAISVNAPSNSGQASSDSTTSTSTRLGHRAQTSSRDIGIVRAQPASATMSDTWRPSMEESTRTPERHARAQAQLDAAQAQFQPSFQSPALSQTASLSSAHNGTPSSSPATSGDKQQYQQSSSSRSPRANTAMSAVAEPNQTWTTVANAPFATMTDGVTLSPSQSTHAYLYYQPGVHASAGPLPSPPRQIFPPVTGDAPPPRPPRLHTPAIGSPALAKRSSDVSIKQPEHTTPAITPSTTASTLVHTSESGDSGIMVTEEPAKPRHSREGAFPVNSVIFTDATPPRPIAKEGLTRKDTMNELAKDLNHAIDEAATRSHKENVPPSVNGREAQQKPSVEHTLPERLSALDLKRQRSRPVLELKREESKSTFRPDQLSRSPSSNYSEDEANDISKPLPDPFSNNNRSQVFMASHETRDESSQRPQSPHRLLDFAKRFSALPRPPSRMSLSKASNKSNVSSSENIPSERLSHEITPKARKAHAPKIRSAWPVAMNFNDVLIIKSPLERSLAYARKINELANYDSGLEEWVITTKHNLTTSSNVAKPKVVSPPEMRSPTERSFTFQPRHASRGSIGSEMTFPKRADAYVATNLLVAPSQEPVPQGPPPALPYPILAQGVPPHLSSRQSIGVGSPSVRSSSSRTGLGGGGFFASIGRKTSTKRERGADAPPNKLISKRVFASPPAPPAPEPRPVQLSASPHLPGGPRAPPGRMQRAQSVIAPKSTPSPVPAPASASGHSHIESENEAFVSRRASSHRSPSVMAAPMSRSATVPQASADTQNFGLQLSRLADIMPTARKDILAGYLTRAGGQEMLALGRYLDDEKNGLLPKN